jgi:cyclophilin family peptidyl-prolyl cis-trans isomerase/HEAT repeat protein
MMAAATASAALAAFGCATAPPPAPPVITLEQKMAWILQLEDQRILRLDPPPIPEPPPGRRARVAAPPPDQPADLSRLIADEDARIRRRAAIAIGRVGLDEGIALLSPRLADSDPDVRGMAAFGLGLIGAASAAEALAPLLMDPDPVVRGRAAEALGLVGAKDTAPAIGKMVAEYAASAAVTALAPDDEAWPAAPEAEAFRLGIYALVRLRAYEPLAAAVLDQSGRPVTSWWPVAFALQRVGDPRAQGALVHLLRVPGSFTRAFAARGLGALRDRSSVEALTALAAPGKAPLPVTVSAIRALGQIGDAAGSPPLTAVLADPRIDPNIRLEAVAALGALRSRDALPYLEEYVTDAWPVMRIAALRAAAAIDPEHFAMVLGSLPADRDWTVRAALAEVLATLPPDVARARLEAMLDDEDRRVLPAVLRGLVRIKAPGAADRALKLLAEPDFGIRAAAASLVGQLRPEGGADALRAALKESESDAANDARLAAMSALAAYGPAAALEPVKARLADRDWAVRLHALGLLDKLDPDGDYEAAIRPAPGTPPAPYDSPQLIAPPYSPRAFIETEKGTIEFELTVLDAPQTAANFMNLARKGFFNGLRIHRVVPNFVVQDGDPRGDGQGGPGYTIRDELNERPYLRGTVGMALSGPDTGGSQFFITHSPQPHLDAGYTVFGRVVNGMDVVDRIQQGDTIQRVRIWDGNSWE